MRTNKENWTAIKPKAYEEIARAIEGCAIYEPNNSETWNRVNVVVNNLFSCDNVNYTPDGKAVLCILPQADIEHLLA